jgi:hypothetical protein
MDRHLGAGAIPQGMLTIAPGHQTRPHTHRAEESMTLLAGRLRGLIGGQVAEVDGLATFLAPANAVHALRNVGVGPAVLCIASPGVKVGTYGRGGESEVGPARRAGVRRSTTVFEHGVDGVEQLDGDNQERLLRPLALGLLAPVDRAPLRTPADRVDGGEVARRAGHARATRRPSGVPTRSPLWGITGERGAPRGSAGRGPRPAGRA